MHKSVNKILGFTVFSAFAAFTSAAYSQDDTNLPPLPEYYAQGEPKSTGEKIKEATTTRGLTGFYFGGKYTYGNVSADDISRTGSTVPPGGITPSAAQTDASDTKSGFTVYMGYAMPWFRIPSRIEIEYQYYPSVDYSPNPAFLPSNDQFSLGLNNGSFQSQALFGNLYYDINFGSRLVPYIGGGLGAAFNKTEGTAVNNNDPTQSQDAGDSTTNFAWNVRGGLRFFIAPWAIADLGYQYVSFGGSAKWNFFNSDGFTNSLESGTPSANNIMLGFTIQFT